VNPAPQRWATAQLHTDATQSAANFREERLAASDAWARHVEASTAKFDQLLPHLAGPEPLSDMALAAALKSGLGEALRYIAGPPISEDDLRVLADVEALGSMRRAADPAVLARVRAVLLRAVDTLRFPWLKAGRDATAEELSAAKLSSAVLLASQRIATERRMFGKDSQEAAVKAYLGTLGLQEAAPAPIHTIVHGPQAGQFCGECQLGGRKADVVVRLYDTRLLAIECKVSNSATNSVKRLNNDAAAKAEYWLKQFGQAQVVPAALLSGVFKVLNLEQAQERGLALFWAHDLLQLRAFIDATKSQA
jgi:hypothetical protein